MAEISIDQFLAVDVRIGTIVAAETFPEARKPAYRLTLDFGAELGLKRSSAQITQLYTPDTLVGRQVLAVVNLPPRRIGPMLRMCSSSAFPTRTARSCWRDRSGPSPTAAACIESMRI